MARLSRPFLGIKPQPGFSCSLVDNPNSTSSPAILRFPLVHYPCQARGRLAVARCGSASLSVGPSGDFSSSNQRLPLASAAVAAAMPPIGREKCLLFLGEFFLGVSLCSWCVCRTSELEPCRRDLQQVFGFCNIFIRPS